MITVNQISFAVVVSVVAAFLAIAVLTARPGETARLADAGTERSTIAARNETRTATVQVLAGFGLLGLWIISGAVMIGKARGDHTFVLGRSNTTPSEDTTTE